MLFNYISALLGIVILFLLVHLVFSKIDLTLLNVPQNELIYTACTMSQGPYQSQYKTLFSFAIWLGYVIVIALGHVM